MNKQLIFSLLLLTCTLSFGQQSRHESRYFALDTQLDLTNGDPYLLRSAEALKLYVLDLCALLKIKRYRDCIIHHVGDAQQGGFSLMQLVEKGYIACQCVNKTNNAYINLFCSTPYDAQRARDFTERFFKAKQCKVRTVERA